MVTEFLLYILDVLKFILWCFGWVLMFPIVALFIGGMMAVGVDHWFPNKMLDWILGYEALIK